MEQVKVALGQLFRGWVGVTPHVSFTFDDCANHDPLPTPDHALTHSGTYMCLMIWSVVLRYLWKHFLLHRASNSSFTRACPRVESLLLANVTRRKDNIRSFHTKQFDHPREARTCRPTLGALAN
jgi:hypothetical protein